MRATKPHCSDAWWALAGVSLLLWAAGCDSPGGAQIDVASGNDGGGVILAGEDTGGLKDGVGPDASKTGASKTDASNTDTSNTNDSKTDTAKADTSIPGTAVTDASTADTAWTDTVTHADTATNADTVSAAAADASAVDGNGGGDAATDTAPPPDADITPPANWTTLPVATTSCEDAKTGGPTGALCFASEHPCIEHRFDKAGKCVPGVLPGKSCSFAKGPPCRQNHGTCTADGSCGFVPTSGGEDCPTGNQCMLGICDKGVCKHKPKSWGSCSDGNECNAGKCVAGVCKLKARTGETCGWGYSPCIAKKCSAAAQCVKTINKGNPCKLSLHETDQCHIAGACDAVGLCAPVTAVGKSCYPGDPCRPNGACAKDGTCTGKIVAGTKCWPSDLPHPDCGSGTCTATGSCKPVFHTNKQCDKNQLCSALSRPLDGADS